MRKKDAEKKRKKEWTGGRLVAFAVVAGAVCGFLLYQSGKNPPPSGGMPARVEVTEQKPLSVGDELPVVPVVSLSGERLEIRAPGGTRQVLLFIFSPTCSACHEILPIWKELVDEAKALSVEVVAISTLDPVRTAEYVRRNQISWSVFCLAGREASKILRLERVPMTLLIGASGRIAQVVDGQLTSDQKDEIFRAMSDSG